ncbi:hypothetical protein TCAL_11845 [Tigriopus californicus]|uniref:Spaetzle domain-containing protein n=1 Tax=Tigriopus californicus TaxID=6832 RepID=A0A553PU32_TIGCA|nr:hypothetical protein TCAL_11845 [Tigriopus californicus]
MFNLTTVFLNEGDPSHEAVDLAELLQRADVEHYYYDHPSPLDTFDGGSGEDADEIGKDNDGLSLISHQRLKLNSLKERVENLIYRQMDKSAEPEPQEIEETPDNNNINSNRKWRKNPDLLASKSSTYYQNYLAKKVQRELENLNTPNHQDQQVPVSRNPGSQQTLFRTGGHEESALSLEDLDVNALFGNGDKLDSQITPREIHAKDDDSSELRESVMNQILDVDQIEFGSRTVPLSEPAYSDENAAIDYGLDYGDVSAGDDVRLTEFLFRPNVSSNSDQRAITATVIEIRSSVSDSSELQSALDALESREESYHLDESLEDPLQDIEDVVPNANRRIDVGEVDFQDPDIRYTSSDRIRLHLPQHEPRSGKTQIKPRVMIRKPLNARQPVFHQQGQYPQEPRQTVQKPHETKRPRYRRPTTRTNVKDRAEKANPAPVLRQRVPLQSLVSSNPTPLPQILIPDVPPSNSNVPQKQSHDPPTRIVYQDFNSPTSSPPNFPVLSLTSLPPDFFELKPMRSASNLMPLRGVPTGSNLNATTANTPIETTTDSPTTIGPPSSSVVNPFLRKVKTTGQPHFEGVNEAPETVSTVSSAPKETTLRPARPHLPPHVLQLGLLSRKPDFNSPLESQGRVRVPSRARPTPYQPNFSDQLPANRRNDDEASEPPFKGPFNVREPPQLGVRPFDPRDENRRVPQTTYDPNLDEAVYVTEPSVRSQPPSTNLGTRRKYAAARPRRPRPRVAGKRLPKPYSGPFAWIVQAFAPARTPRVAQARREGRSRKLETAKKRATCPTRKLFIRPRVAFSVKGQWMYIVNLPRGPAHQRILSEECLTDHCQGGCAKERSHRNESLCELQFVQKRLVALAVDGKRLISELFWIPSTCKCQTSEIQW